MTPEIIEKYNAGRSFANKSFKSGCYAPYVSLLFDPLGNVRVCCQNYSYILGNVRQSTLSEIWNGDNVRRLREALDQNNFDLGCDYCKWQIREGNFSNSFSLHFDGFEVNHDKPVWPVLVEFNITNTCNLECVMCNGEFSSSIRSRREKLPPLPKAYDDRFFEDLRVFLPHVKLAKCLGGEPFLSQEMFRIWDMMIEDKLNIACHVNTNATTYNAKVQRVLDNLPLTFQVSMDGVTKETFEKVRVGADFDTVRENFLKLLAYSRGRPGGYLGLTYCLMRQNWHEFGDFLLYGDSHQVPVSITPVVIPASCSLYTMTAGELVRVVDALRAQDARIRDQLTLNRQVWIDQIDRLENRLANIDSPRPIFASIRLVEPFAELKQGQPLHAPAMDEDAARQRLVDWAGPDAAIGGFICDAADQVTQLVDDATDFLGINSDRCIGRRADVVIAQFRLLWGGGTMIHVVEESESLSDRVFSFQNSDMVTTSVRLITLPRFDERGQWIGSISLGAMKQELALVTIDT